MSNLQDVPLAEPEIMPPIEPDLAGSKSNSLKRFFKLGKKSVAGQENSEDVNEVEDEASKENSKSGSLSRFLTRFKGSVKTDASEPSSSTNTVVEEVHDKPVPNAKLTLKTSISGYWKLLFHRQKAANRHGEDSEEQPATQQAVGLNELQQVQQEQQTDPIKAEDVFIETPTTSNHDLKIGTLQKLADIHHSYGSDLAEEVQTLTISDEIVDPSQENNN